MFLVIIFMGLNLNVLFIYFYMTPDEIDMFITIKSWSVFSSLHTYNKVDLQLINSCIPKEKHFIFMQLKKLVNFKELVKWPVDQKELILKVFGITSNWTKKIVSKYY